MGWEALLARVRLYLLGFFLFRAVRIFFFNVFGEAHNLILHGCTDDRALPSRPLALQVLMLYLASVSLHIRIRCQVHEQLLALEGHALVACLIELHNLIEVEAAEARKSVHVLLSAFLCLNESLELHFFELQLALGYLRLALLLEVLLVVVAAHLEAVHFEYSLVAFCVVSSRRRRGYL